VTLINIIQNRKETFVAFLDPKRKASYVVDCILKFSLLRNGIDRDFYKAIKYINRNTSTSTTMIYTLTGFKGTTGVRHGDNLSPTLFALFINDLAKKFKDMDSGT
jgi:hypothetical protein